MRDVADRLQHDGRFVADDDFEGASRGVAGNDGIVKAGVGCGGWDLPAEPPRVAFRLQGNVAGKFARDDDPRGIAGQQPLDPRGDLEPAAVQRLGGSRGDLADGDSGRGIDGRERQHQPPERLERVLRRDRGVEGEHGEHDDHDHCRLESPACFARQRHSGGGQMTGGADADRADDDPPQTWRVAVGAEGDIAGKRMPQLRRVPFQTVGRIFGADPQPQQGNDPEQGPTGPHGRSADEQQHPTDGAEAPDPLVDDHERQTGRQRNPDHPQHRPQQRRSPERSASRFEMLADQLIAAISVRGSGGGGRAGEAAVAVDTAERSPRENRVTRTTSIIDRGPPAGRRRGPIPLR